MLNITAIDLDKLENWFKREAKQMDLSRALSDLRAVKLEDLPAQVLQWIKDHPKQTTFYILDGVAFFVPGAMYLPVLRMLGFSRLGPVARTSQPTLRPSLHADPDEGTVASLLQSRLSGHVPARGWFAYLQRAAMRGYGKKMLDRFSRVLSKVVGWLYEIVHRSSDKVDRDGDGEPRSTANCASGLQGSGLCVLAIGTAVVAVGVLAF